MNENVYVHVKVQLMIVVVYLIHHYHPLLYFLYSIKYTNLFLIFNKKLNTLLLLVSLSFHVGKSALNSIGSLPFVITFALSLSFKFPRISYQILYATFNSNVRTTFSDQIHK